jgi:hypothetical protein
MRPAFAGVCSPAVEGIAMRSALVLLLLTCAASEAR